MKKSVELCVAVRAVVQATLHREDTTFSDGAVYNGCSLYGIVRRES